MTQYSDDDLIPLPKSSSENESELSDSEISVNHSDEDQTSDSEPECFSFTATQESRKQTQKQTSQAIRVQKDELKRKRKEVYLQNIQQREEKRQKLASKRLPDHVLENLDDEFETAEPEEKLSEFQEEINKEEEVEVIQTAGNVTFKCKVLNPETQKQRYIPKKVAHFKEQMLYGNRIKREKSTRHAVLKKEKQRLKK